MRKNLVKFFFIIQIIFIVIFAVDVLVTCFLNSTPVFTLASLESDATVFNGVGYYIVSYQPETNLNATIPSPTLHFNCLTLTAIFFLDIILIVVSKLKNHKIKNP